MEKSQEKLNRQCGMSTVEMLIAFAIVIMAITAVVGVVFGSQSVGVDTETNQEATFKAQDMLEKARADANKDFNLVNPYSATENLGGISFVKDLDVEPVGLFTKKVTSNVSWVGEYGRNLSVQLTTLLTNPEALTGGDTCSSVLEGDWTHPQKTEYELGADIVGDPSSGFPITSIQSFQGKLYVTVLNSNGNNNDTFLILDISNPAVKPTVLKRIDNNPAVLVGLNDVAIDGGNYAYVANAYGADYGTCSSAGGTNKSCGQMQVIDLSTSTPAVVYTYKVPGVTGSGGQGVGNRIFYKDGIVYLGLAKATGQEFQIIDVGGGGTPGASPTSPIRLGGFEINNGINDIYVKGNYAYIASPNSKELEILDVSNPHAPVSVGGFNAPGGGGPVNGHGKSLYLVGDVLYLGRTLINGDEFYILNNSNPASSLPGLGSMNVQNSGNDTSVNGILTRDFLGFLITNREFQIWRIDNPSNITQYANPLALPPGTGGGLRGTASDCEGNYIFVGSLSSNDKGYISIITSGP